MTGNVEEILKTFEKLFYRVAPSQIFFIISRSWV